MLNVNHEHIPLQNILVPSHGPARQTRTRWGFPNPTDDKCQVHVYGINNDYILEIKNLIGQLLYSKSISAVIDINTVNTSSLAPGMYILTVSDGIEFLNQVKLIISR